MDLAGRKAIVTGASRGIGQRIAVHLSKAGAKVACVSSRPGGCDGTIDLCGEGLRGGEAAGGEAIGLAADMGDTAAIQAMAKEAIEQLGGGVDIVVNNAGVTRDGVFLRMSEEDLDAVLGVNLKGAFLLTQALARPLMKSGNGRVVNVGSVVGIRGNAGQANYAASKAGLIGLTKSLAQELAGRKVTANLVAPGYIETDMTRDLPENVRSELLKSIPLGRLGQGDDVAAAVAFLCSDSAAYITGQVLVVDGGMTM